MNNRTAFLTAAAVSALTVTLGTNVNRWRAAYRAQQRRSMPQAVIYMKRVGPVISQEILDDMVMSPPLSPLLAMQMREDLGLYES